MCSHPWSGKRRRDKHCSIPMWTSSGCSPEVEGLLGLAQVVHLPIAGTFWEGSGSASCLGHRSSDPHPTEQLPHCPEGTDPLRMWTSSWSDRAGDAISVCCHRVQAKAFCCFLSWVHLLFLSGTGQICQAGSDLSKETQEKPHY